MNEKKTNGKSGVRTNGKTTTRVIPTNKVERAEVQKKAKVRKLDGIRGGTACIVERDIGKYLALTLDGCAFQVPNDARVVDWLVASLKAFQEDRPGARAGRDEYEIEYPIKAVV
jgi:hypothetical protein